MRVKKLLALLLSGAFFAGCLSGCDRTIIEHQFHTDTVTDTEYIEVGNSGNQQTLLTAFFTSHKITVIFHNPLAYQSITEEEFCKNFGSYLNSQEIDPIQIQKFYNPLEISGTDEIPAAALIKVIECDETEESQASAWIECINTFYSAVIAYASDPDNGWNWDKFYENGKTVAVSSATYKLEGNYYFCAYMIHYSF